MQFKGIYTPAVTPYKQDFTIDKKAYAEVLESLIDAKVHGIIVAGSTGEYYAQTQQERLELAEYAKEVIAGRLPLIIGTGAIRTEDSVIYAKHAKEIGADAILVPPLMRFLQKKKTPAMRLLLIKRPIYRSCFIIIRAVCRCRWEKPILILSVNRRMLWR